MDSSSKINSKDHECLYFMRDRQKKGRMKFQGVRLKLHLETTTKVYQ